MPEQKIKAQAPSGTFAEAVENGTVKSGSAAPQTDTKIFGTAAEHIRNDQIPDLERLTKEEQKKVKNGSPKERQEIYRNYLNTYGVMVTGDGGKRIKVLPEKYFKSLGELYRAVDAINGSPSKMKIACDSIALKEFKARYDKIAGITKRLREVLERDVTRFDQIGLAFAETDDALANGISNK